MLLFNVFIKMDTVFQMCAETCLILMNRYNHDPFEYVFLSNSEGITINMPIYYFNLLLIISLIQMTRFPPEKIQLIPQWKRDAVNLDILLTTSEMPLTSQNLRGVAQNAVYILTSNVVRYHGLIVVWLMQWLPHNEDAITENKYKWFGRYCLCISSNIGLLICYIVNIYWYLHRLVDGWAGCLCVWGGGGLVGSLCALVGHYHLAFT